MTLQCLPYQRVVAFSNPLPFSPSRAGAGSEYQICRHERVQSRIVVAKTSFNAEPEGKNWKTSGLGGSYGNVHLIGTGPGDPRMLTVGAVELMREADVVLYDRLVSEAILSYANPTAERILVGKGRGIGTGSQVSIQEQMVLYARSGMRVVRLKGGDPSVFGRVGSELAHLRDHGIQVDVSPGVTTASGVAASLGFPLTHGGIADGVCLITGHLGASWIRSEMVDRMTLVVYMGLQELSKLLDRLNEGDRNGVPAVAVQSGTTESQRAVYGTTTNLAQRVQTANLQSPTIVIIGETVRMAPGWSAE